MKMASRNYGLLENGVFHAEQSSDGYIYKNFNAFNSKEGICYIPSIVFESVSTEDITLEIIEALGEKAYSYNDFLELCNNNENAAEYVFSCVSWESPSTTLEQLCVSGILCEHCFDELEDGEECSKEECIAKNN